MTEDIVDNQEMILYDQHKFNTRFLIGLTIFMFFYRFYSMHIDKEGLIINSIENAFIQIFNRVNML